MEVELEQTKQYPRDDYILYVTFYASLQQE